MAAPTREQLIASLDSDLRFLFNEQEVDAAHQARLAALGVRSLPLLAGLDESREQVRAALKDDLPLDYTASMAARLQMARLLAVWQAATVHLKVQEQNRMESKVGTQQRLVQPSELHAMRLAVEAKLGKLKDKEVSCKSLIAAKLEQIEQNQPVVENVQEVASLEDAKLESYSAVTDPATNVLKIKPGKTITGTPSTPDNLRLRHRRIGLAWDFLASRHSLRSWLSDNMTDVMRQFSDYILGSQVAGLSAGDHTPSWNLVLEFEHEARKSAYRWLRDGETNSLQASFAKVIKDTEVLNRHLVIPFSLRLRSSAKPDTGGATLGNPWITTTPGGKAKGKGKKGLVQQEAFVKKLTKTPDGKPICWKFNKPSGRSDGQCKFLHVCQRCLGKHAYSSCPKVKLSPVPGS